MRKKLGRLGAFLGIMLFVSAAAHAYTDCLECKQACDDQYWDDVSECDTLTGAAKTACRQQAWENKMICNTNCETDFDCNAI